MKKVALIINSPLYARSYLSTDLVSALTKKYQVAIILRDDIELKDSIPNVAIFKYTLEENVQNKAIKLLNIAMYKLRDRSSSFRLRMDRDSLKSQILLILKSKSAKSLLGGIARLPLSLVKRVKFRIACFLTSDHKYRLLLDSLPLIRSLVNALREAKPDLILLPSSAYQAEDGVIPKIGRKLGIKTFSLVDNWDNLSSKSVILDIPDLIAVWGEQSKKHAINIQGILSDKITLLGAPRFDSYFRFRNVPVESNFPFPYVLFVGTALSFNEARVLQILDREINENSTLYGDLKVVYRPHPWRQGRDNIRSLELKNVVVDPQVSENYFSGKSSVEFQPELDYYPSLIKNAKFIVGGLTSMLIESLIFYKRFVGLAHHEKLNPVSPDRVLSEYVHFRDIKNLSIVELCHGLADLPDIFKANFLEINAFPVLSAERQAQIDLERNYFLYSDDRSYAQRLIDNIDKLICD